MESASIFGTALVKMGINASQEESIMWLLNVGNRLIVANCQHLGIEKSLGCND